MRTDQLTPSRSAADRGAERRDEPGLLERLATNPDTHLLLVDAQGHVALTGPAIHPDLPNDGLTPPNLIDSPGTTIWEGPGTRSSWGLPDLRVGYLGASAPARCLNLTVLYISRELSDDAATGPAWIAVVVPQTLEVPDTPKSPATDSDAEDTAVDHPGLCHLLERYPLSALQAVGARVMIRNTGPATTATALTVWHARSTCCPACGGRTEIIEAGQTHRCSDRITVHFPRTDPAVIMAVTDTSDRLLLMRGATWAPRRYSIVVGFIETGKSTEAAAAREVREETRLRVTDVEYLAPQPWPFPHPFMLGYRARLAPDEDRSRPDGQEVAEAHLVPRDEPTAAVDDSNILLPGPTSITQLLIEDWYDDPIVS